MKLALTIWNGRISPVLDVARRMLVLDVDGGVVRDRHEVDLPGGTPHLQASAIVVLAPRVLICGAVSRPLADTLAGRGIKIIPFVAGAVDEVLQAWLAGRLDSPALAMPGCCRRRCGGRGVPHGGRGCWGRG